MKDKNVPGCRRTGHCCSRLPGSMALDAVVEMSRLSKKAKKECNLTKKFLTSWTRDAKKAIKEDKAIFSCSFLEGDNVCGLQDRKPHICSGSLSAERLTQHKSFREISFFSHECGWLAGAPKELIEIVKVCRGTEKLPLSDEEGRAVLEAESLALKNKYAGFEYLFEDGRWTKREYFSDEYFKESLETVKELNEETTVT
jgi:Fe-S-cluster containining protein